VHLLHPEADCGQDDEAGVSAVALQREHHSLGDGGQARCHGNGQAEGHGGKPGQDAGVAGQGEGIACLQRGEVAAQGAGDGWRAAGVEGLTGTELDPLEALGAENMEAIQHPGAFVVLVVLLVADGTLHVRGLRRGGAEARLWRSWVPLLGRWDNTPRHGDEREGEWSWVLGDGKMKLVEESSEDGQICEEKITLTKPNRSPGG